MLGNVTSGSIERGGGVRDERESLYVSVAIGLETQRNLEIVQKKRKQGFFCVCFLLYFLLFVFVCFLFVCFPCFFIFF